MTDPMPPDEPTPPRPPRPPYYVQSLERGLAVIRAFDADHPKLTLTDIARRTGLTRAASRRFLLTLVDLRFVATDGKLFSLTPRVLELGYAFLSSQTLPEVAQPHLERLAAEVRESSSVSVLDGRDVVYVARVATSRIMRVAITVGTRFPAYATSMGRVLLAFLPPEELDGYLTRGDMVPFTSHTVTNEEELRSRLAAVRRQGYAIVDQELEEGLRSVAAPVRVSSGRVAAAVNVSAHASRTSLKEMRSRLVPPLLATAAKIEADLLLTSRNAGDELHGRP